MYAKEIFYFMGRPKEGVETYIIREIIPYISEGAFRCADQNGTLDGSRLIPPKKGAGRYSLINARERKRFHEKAHFYNPRESGSTRGEKANRENDNRKLLRRTRGY